MKRTVAWAAGVLAIGLAGYFGSRGWAQQAAPAAPARPAAEPRTRVALLNMHYVIKNYEKWKSFQNELKGDYKVYEERLKANRAKQEMLVAQAKDPKATPEQQESAAKQVKQLQREAEDLSNEGKATIGKKQGDQLVIVFKEVQDAAMRYALAHNFEMVLHYSDALTATDYYNAGNIMHKLDGALLPLYYQPDLDISLQVVTMLNSHYQGQTTQTAPSAARPSGN